MMLDSSLGKILSTKPVEPSITNNVDNTTTTTTAVATTPSTTISPTNEDPKAHSTKSEAEVRLVVRFFVEEHIVFNGKVEKIKQLESEELSRIVSRIAWDGAKEEKKHVLQKDDVKNDENTKCIIESQEKLDLCDPTNNSPYRDHDSLLQADLNENGLIRDQHDESPANELKESVSPLSVDTISTTEQVVPNVEAEGETIEETTASELVTKDISPQSDYEPANPIRDHLCETEIKQFERLSPGLTDEDQPQQESRHEEISNSQVSRYASLKSTIDQIEFAANAERQTIVETIYDCVYNVDMESRRDQANGLTNIAADLDEAETKDADKIAEKIRRDETSNETTSEDAKPDKQPLIETVNVPPNNEPTQETIPHDSDENQPRDKDAQTNQAGKNDLNPKVAPTRKPDNGGSCSTRRKIAHDNGPTSKRIRRTNSRDHQNHRSTNRTAENAIDRHDAILAGVGEIVDDEDGQFARHSKVFAKWSDNHFYPGTILKSSRDRKFEIGFFDGARKDVAESDLIPSSNILRKQVRVSIAKDYCVNAIVHQQLSSNGKMMFDVEYQQNGLVRKCVPLGDIFLTPEQGIPLINQTIKPDKNPDESMFAGVDLDNIVHVKRSRRLQEMEESETVEECPNNTPTSTNSGRRKRGQYNMRNITNRVRTSNRVEVPGDRVAKRSLSDINNPDTPASSCSPDHLKTTPDSPSSSSPSESSGSRDASKFCADVMRSTF